MREGEVSGDPRDAFGGILLGEGVGRVVGDAQVRAVPLRGEVDFAAFAAALTAAGFAGTTVYELVDGEDPAPRLAADFAALAKAGWELS